MKYRAGLLCLGLLAITLVGAAPLPDPVELIRRGNSAFAEQKYEAASDFYEKAEGRISDPGLAAFNKAAALYQLKHYREAELHYRNCLEDAAGLRRARALYGLGNTLLQRLDRDSAILEQAIDAYTLCLRQPELDPEFASDVRHNLEVAKLMLAKTPPKKDEKEPPDGSKPKNNNDRKQEPKDDPHLKANPTGKEKPDPGHQGTPVKADKSLQATPTEEKMAGQGTLPQIPDKDRLQSMTSHDADRHLDLAVQRIHQDRRAYRYKAARTPGSGPLDW